MLELSPKTRFIKALKVEVDFCFCRGKMCLRQQGIEMFRASLIALAVSLAIGFPANAGFQSWTVKQEEDPFSGGKRITANFMSSMRSGIIIICDSAKPGLLVRAIPGFEYDAAMDGSEPTMKFAFDGKLLFEAQGQVGSVGENLAVSQVELDSDQARRFADAFAAAKKQIAVDDGISDKPHLLSARGSTASGQAVASCIAQQEHSS